jgi:hypothetical protein
MLVPLGVLTSVGRTDLWLSFSFGVLFTGVSDLVVKDAYATRVRWSVGVALVGAVLTVLGYVLGGANWALVALAVAVTTLLSFLVTAYGLCGAVAGVLLNIWFLITLSITHALDNSPAQTWPLAGPQALAWLAGGTLWLVVAWGLWMAQRRRQPTMSPPPQAAVTARLSRPLVTFAVIAAVAVALATAVAWGLELPNADWMPVAAVVAMTPSLEASTYVAGQRVAGALVGAILAALLLGAIHDRTFLAVMEVVIGALGVALHEVNYALYCASISTVVLTWLGLPHPTSLTTNWERVAWTVAGVGIALCVTLVADWAHTRMSQRAARAERTPTAADPQNCPNPDEL